MMACKANRNKTGTSSPLLSFTKAMARGKLCNMPSLTLLMMLAILECMSCVRTGLEDDCEYPIRLRYSYVYNREDRDLLREEVPNLNLYLFDLDNGRPVKNVELSIEDLLEDGSCVIYAPPGRYCLVSWGGAGERYRTNAGEHISEHDVRIEADEDGNVTHRRQHLWHAITDDILVNGMLTPVHEVELLKLSNDVTVTLRTKARNLLDKNLSSTIITASNGRHDYKGAIHKEPVQVTYIPETDDSSGAISHSFTTLYLHENDNSNLMVKYGENEIFNGSLTGLIARQPNIEFGLDDTFQLLFEISPGNDGNASVSVSVNGWEVDDFEVTLN